MSDVPQGRIRILVEDTADVQVGAVRRRGAPKPLGFGTPGMVQAVLDAALAHAQAEAAAGRPMNGEARIQEYVDLHAARNA
jgi:hypothetical protein